MCTLPRPPLQFGHSGRTELDANRRRCRDQRFGRLALPDHIGFRTGPLPKPLWDIVRTHSEAGARMLRRIPTLRCYADAVRSHHERWDGRGYPDRLKGRSIPLEARLIAVIDALLTMLAAAPNRPPLRVERVIEMLKRGSGRRWEPRAIEAVVAVITPPEEEYEATQVAS